eukprot:6472520-Amphidinium_carterae.4
MDINHLCLWRFGCLCSVDDEDAAVQLLQSAFTMPAVWRGTEIGVLSGGSTLPLKVWKEDFVAMKLQIGVGSSMGMLAPLDVSLMKRSHYAVSTYFSCIGLYGWLRLTSFKGVASHWTWKSMDRWCTFLKDIGLSQDHCQVSAQSKRNGFLPFPGVSSAGVLALLVRWVAMPQQQGGLSENKAGAREILDSLLSICVRSSPNFRFALVGTWQFLWPAPQQTRSQCDMPISADGIADLTALHAAASDGNALARSWIKRSQLQLVNNRAMLVDVLLAACKGGKPMYALLGQLVCLLSRKLDEVLHEAKVGKTPAGGRFRLWGEDWLSLLHAGNQLHHRLAQYVHGCQTATCG